MQPGLAAVPRPAQDPVREVEDRIRAGLDGKSYDHWFRDKVRLSVSDNTLTVGVGSPFILAWMQRQFSVVFRSAARQVLGASARVVIEVDGRLAVATERKPAPKRNRRGQVPPELPAQPDRAVPKRRLADLAEFISGPESQMAYAAAGQLCAEPATFRGPLYLFGNVGLGKTHLLEGISKQLRHAPGMRQVAYFTAESFSNYYTEALRARTMPAFRNRFRMLDAFIVDDVNFFDGKRGLQQEFLHTLQHLEHRGRLIILAADCHPRLLTRTADELVSRYSSGTVCRIGAPDFETRLKIVERLAASFPAPPSRAVLEYVAQKFRGNVRELAGALNCLAVYARMAPGRLGVGAARRVLGELERDCLRTLRLADIERAVCDVLGVEPEDVRSARRARAVSQPRMIAMYLARKHTQATYGEIGAHFGGRNHSTVIAAVRKMSGLLQPHDEAPDPGKNSTMLQESIRSIEGQLAAG